jgi:hypothetical protein
MQEKTQALDLQMKKKKMLFHWMSGFSHVPVLRFQKASIPPINQNIAMVPGINTQQVTFFLMKRNSQPLTNSKALYVLVCGD